jgi:hypothetical protein
MSASQRVPPGMASPTESNQIFGLVMVGILIQVVNRQIALTGKERLAAVYTFIIVAKERNFTVSTKAHRILILLSIIAARRIQTI